MADQLTLSVRSAVQAFFAALAFCNINIATAVSIETVSVGNAGNPPLNDYGYYFGAVEYDYRISKYEVTNAEYVEFLNGVDPTGANKLALYHTSMTTDSSGGIVRNTTAANGLKYEIKSGREQNPVVFVSWFDAIRFTNWLNNGQGNGNTETGAYTLLGGTATPTNYSNPSRNVGAKWWLPTFDEQFKASYHKNDGVTSNYWDYPFSSNSLPNSDQPPGSGTPTPANTANFNRNDNLANGYNDGYAVTGSTTFTNSQNYLTNVGAYTHSQSPYGTFDQGGNVWEWTESQSGASSGIFGGGWSSNVESLRAPMQGGYQTITNQLSSVGFRVAARPEPPATRGKINIAVDIDSSVAPSAASVGAPPATRPGFLSWNATWTFNYPDSGELLNDYWMQLFTQGVEFDLQAFRPGTSELQRPTYLGSRERLLVSGQSDELLRDFVFAEGSAGTFLYLTISDLPVGRYRMTTWHYDRLEPGIAMQIEVGDKQGDMIAAATTIVKDQFLLSTDPQFFEFQVSSANSIKEIIFRSDNARNRTRLNGFILVAIPEPATAIVLVGLGMILISTRQTV